MSLSAAHIGQTFVALEWGYIEGESDGEVHLFSLGNKNSDPGSQGLVYARQVGTEYTSCSYLSGRSTEEWLEAKYLPFIPRTAPRR